MSEIDLHGKLIALEGMDFTGKSTLVPLLCERLRAAGYDVVASREPGGTPVGELVRTILLDRRHETMLPLSELLLFMVSRAQHVHEIVLPALEQNKTVVTSRYRMSSLAYQGYGRQIDQKLIRSLNEAATVGRKADVTFVIDLPVEVALRRKQGQGDRIEQEAIAFYERVRHGYLDLARNDPSVHVLDGTATVSELDEALANALGV